MPDSSTVSSHLLDRQINQHTSFRLIVGLMVRVCPVHASKACLWATIQSIVPFRWTTAKEVIGDFVEIRAVIGVADDTL